MLGLLSLTEPAVPVEGIGITYPHDYPQKIPQNEKIHILDLS
jgi:hypothetical protein